ncbi:transcriptional regulator (plasmid) [Streptomyces seoulensis]|uniref:Transcriptional regulator n=1 Tax=Streptomyces seoulensis TaxID=73044 RepID=A0A4P6U574_STRSO|nr:helix-turn-helix domain-containing protein [Streptomyces seoulensis]QBJ94497.1 transcriptional regulator [Streptomyces seoulensis]
MPPTQQWLHTTSGRITTCPHSWMTAVHWIAGSGLYTPARTHGPRWGTTTIAIAQEIAALKECRPSVDYLARKLKVAERTVQYHLGMLREAGLLVYRTKGTRISGIGGRASEFERVIPAAFDHALGIRTIGEGATRRPIGAAEESRTLLGKLAKKAARKTRRPRHRTPSSKGPRCTPMEGGTTGTSSAASTNSPPESKLASGQAKSPTPKKSNHRPRKLNKIGRRFQVAGELIRTVTWLQHANRERIAWVIRKFTDQGWTAREIQAAAELTPLPARGVSRPSGLLASRLASKHLVFDTPAKRAELVAMWEDSQHAAQERHAEPDYSDLGAGPQSAAARRAWDVAFNTISGRLAADTTPVEDSPLDLEDLTSEEVVQMRLDAMADPGLLLTTIELAGEQYARRLYTSRLVDQTLALEAINARRNTLAPAF